MSMCPHVLQSLQKHHHPDVSKAAALINTPLGQQEDDISKVLETTAYQVGLLEAPLDLLWASWLLHVLQLMEQELQQTVLKNVPLEFEPAAHLLQGGGGALKEHFCLSC